MRPMRLLVPLMFCCRLTAIYGSTLFSSNCSLLEVCPTPRCAACILYEVFDFWVREPLAVFVWRLPPSSSRVASPPSTPCIWFWEPAVSVRGCELEKLALRRYVDAEEGWLPAMGRLPAGSRSISYSFAELGALRCTSSLCWTSARTPSPP